MNVGILALQGDVPEHRAAAASVVGASHVALVREPRQLEGVGALFLPGGESTTIARLLQDSGLWDPLADRLREGLPIFATCAGLILIARDLEKSPSGADPPTFGVLDVLVRRNDYGPQGESCETELEVTGLKPSSFRGVFIRSPRILAVGPQATPFAHRGAEVVGVRAGATWGLAFHPELTGDRRLHALFLHSLRGQR
jgi:pyridoxal 5'-phosphate synthase pdxT subunit